MGIVVIPNKSPKKNRRLLLILAFLLLDIDSEQNSFTTPFLTSNQTSTIQEPHDLDIESGNIIWLVDKSTGNCLGEHGFGECGDVNMWKSYVQPSSGLIRLQTIYNHLDNSSQTKSTCLGRKEKLGIPSSVQSQSCFQNIFRYRYTSWNYESNSGKLFSKSVFHKPHCLNRITENGVNIQPCDEGYTSFYPIKFNHHYYRDQSLRDIDDQTMYKETSWTCPNTGLVLPISLQLGEGYPNQRLMGGNVFIKQVVMNFKVYTVAFYVDPVKAATDPTLSPFFDKSAAQLSRMDKFYSVLSDPRAGYDRTLFIKLAMTLNTADVLRGLTEELNLKPANSLAFQTLLTSFKSKTCPRGMEILFTWRAADVSKGISDCLEIRIDGQTYAILTQPGVAQDFFSKYLNDDPVSPLAKVSFSDNFPTILRSSLNDEKDMMDDFKAIETDSLNKFHLDSSSEDIEYAYFETLTMSIMGWRPSTQIKSSKGKVRSYLKNMLIRRRKETFTIHTFATFFVLLNILVLIMVSLPPATARVRVFVSRQSSRARTILTSVRRKIRMSLSLRRSMSADSVTRKNLNAVPLSPRKAMKRKPGASQRMESNVKNGLRKSLSNSCVFALRPLS